jgi:hypothetical protein
MRCCSNETANGRNVPTIAQETEIEMFFRMGISFNLIFAILRLYNKPISNGERITERAKMFFSPAKTIANA